MTDTPCRAVCSSILPLALLTIGVVTTTRANAQSFAPVPVIRLDAPVSNKVTQISQFGITWFFSEPQEVGRFANGDWWVLGPVNIVGIDPPCTTTGGRTINGSVVNPTAGLLAQGFDSSMYGTYSPGDYKPALNVALNLSDATPLVLKPGSSLISAISGRQAATVPQLQTAAVLTCVGGLVRAGSFRPPFVAGNKTIKFNTSQLNYSLLANLTPVQSTPALATVEKYFERPWIDHAPGWLARYMHPADNMPDYGRDMASNVGVGAQMLHLNFSIQQKKTLLVRYVQLGIDLQGIVEGGGRRNWVPDGGQASGRKWPILFAGLMLGDPTMSAIGANTGVAFGEDAQTFFVQETSPGVYNYGYGGYGPQDVGLPDWGIRHSTTPSLDAKGWEDNSYRTCCTANAWSGFVLAARIMGQQTAWNDDSLFAYMDRYLQVEQIQWRRFWDPTGFTSQMWTTYRPRF